jgi:hypothetical protein
LGRYDQIIYMEDSVVAEIGSLTDLLSKKGGFFSFVNLRK